MSAKLLERMPGYRLVRDKVRHRWSNPFTRFAPPGHFYSPLPDPKFVEIHKARLFDRRIRDVPGIETNPDGQIALVAEISKFYAALPFQENRTAGLRYFFNNSFFCYGDAIMLYSMLRRFRPRRVVEVGSGFSSAVMLDTNDLFLSGETEFTFIEPFPERLLSLLNDDDRERHSIQERIVQDVEDATFSA
jgi:hypothetical protein